MPPINGNKIVEEIRRERNLPGSYGMIRNSKTGEGIEFIGDAAPEGVQQSAFVPSQRGWIPPQQTSPEPTDTAVNDIYAQEQNANSGGGMMSQPSAGSSGMAVDSGSEPMLPDDMSMDEIYEAQKDYINDSSKFKSYLDKTGLSMDELLQNLDPEVSYDDVKLFMNPENISSTDDVIRAGIAQDAILDAGDFDAEKFFQTGELVPCEGGCQERRQMQKAQAREHDDKMAINDAQPMAMPDDEFEKRYAAMLV